MSSLIFQEWKDLDKPCIIRPYQNASVSYATLYAECQRLKQHLTSLISPHRVYQCGLLSYNTMPFILSYLGCSELGKVTLVPLNPAWTGSEVRDALDRMGGIQWLLYDMDCDRIHRSGIVEGMDGVIRIGLSYAEHELGISPYPDQPSHVPVGGNDAHQDRPYMLLQTSGSTGKPKGRSEPPYYDVPHTHRHLIDELHVSGAINDSQNDPYCPKNDRLPRTDLQGYMLPFDATLSCPWLVGLFFIDSSLQWHSYLSTNVLRDVLCGTLHTIQGHLVLGCSNHAPIALGS